MSERISYSVIREMLERITGTPWITENYQRPEATERRIYGKGARGVCKLTHPDPIHQIHDAHFIASAPAIVDQLLADVEMLRTRATNLLEVLRDRDGVYWESKHNEGETMTEACACQLAEALEVTK